MARIELFLGGGQIITILRITCFPHLCARSLVHGPRSHGVGEPNEGPYFGSVRPTEVTFCDRCRL